MHERLENDIKKAFGHCYGSKKLKENLREIITNALDRYDEEIENGASPEEAYHTAYASIGSIKELRLTLGAIKRRNTILFCVLGAMLAAILTVFALYGLWICSIPISVCAAIGFPALYRLLNGRYRSKAPHIAALSICGAIIAYLVLIGSWTLPTIIASAVEKNQSLVYDYTEQAAKVESVSYVQITDLAYGKGTDTFDYTVLELFGDDQTGVLMNDLGNLPYLRYDDAPRALKNGDCGFLIRFDPEASDLLCFLYCEHTVAEVKRTPTGIRITTHSVYCRTRKWNCLLRSTLSSEALSESFEGGARHA